MARVWCKHYRGMHEKTQCEAGVLFASLEHYGTKLFSASCPCFGPEQSGDCEKKEYPTAEEMAAEEAEFAVRIAIGRGQIKLCIECACFAYRTLEQLIAEADHCEHGVMCGEWCEPCNRAYKEAQFDPENGNGESG